jgi:hypothetical protein
VLQTIGANSKIERSRCDRSYVCSLLSSEDKERPGGAIKVWRRDYAEDDAGTVVVRMLGSLVADLRHPERDRRTSQRSCWSIHSAPTPIGLSQWLFTDVIRSLDIQKIRVTCAGSSCDIAYCSSTIHTAQYVRVLTRCE